MESLIKSGLFGGGLVTINTPELVARYCDCLKEFGLPPTTLTSFEVDAVGWSPKIANEFGNVDYLSLGTANRCAIIITPEQNGLPVYRQVHSFDRAAIEHVFQGAGAQIAVITSRSGLCFNFAKELTKFLAPKDLLSIEWINIWPSDTAGLMKGSTEQRSLVAEFKASETRWADAGFRNQLRSSFRQHGDMRFRSAVIPEMKFVDVRSFYTRIFNGVYVFRDFPKSEQLLIVEDAEVPRGSSKEVPVHHIEKSDLPAILEDEDIVDVPLSWYKQVAGKAALDELQKYLFAHAYYSAGGTENLHEMSSGQRRRWMVSHETELGDTFFELERFILDVRKGVAVKELKPSPELRAYLMQPSKKAQAHDLTERVVWHLIARLVPFDLERMFVRNKLRFYDLYQTWSEAQQRWAIQDLVQKGHPKPLPRATVKK